MLTRKLSKTWQSYLEVSSPPVSCTVGDSTLFKGENKGTNALRTNWRTRHGCNRKLENNIYVYIRSIVKGFVKGRSYNILCYWICLVYLFWVSPALRGFQEKLDPAALLTLSLYVLPHTHWRATDLFSAVVMMVLVLLSLPLIFVLPAPPFFHL